MIFISTVQVFINKYSQSRIDGTHMLGFTGAAKGEIQSCLCAAKREILDSDSGQIPGCEAELQMCSKPSGATIRAAG